VNSFHSSQRRSQAFFSGGASHWRGQSSVFSYFTQRSFRCHRSVSACYNRIWRCFGGAWPLRPHSGCATDSSAVLLNGCIVSGRYSYIARFRNKGTALNTIASVGIVYTNSVTLPASLKNDSRQTEPKFQLWLWRNGWRTFSSSPQIKKVV